jgi:hypothetical protein
MFPMVFGTECNQNNEHLVREEPRLDDKTPQPPDKAGQVDTLKVEFGKQLVD